MSSDGSDDIIPDSQESSAEDVDITQTISFTPVVSNVLFTQNDELPKSINIPSNRILPKMTDMSINTNDLNHDHSDSLTPVENNSGGTVKRFDPNAYAPQRSLRKRTAIQRMPYSLERIKHRQLLEGYDVSAFETVSNQVDISALENRNKNSTIIAPAREINPNSGNIMNHEDELFEYSMVIPSEDSDFSFEEDDYDISVRDQNDEGTDDIPLLTSSVVPQINGINDNDEDDILFRGKKLNVKTGYRGILPRMIWEKQLSSSCTKSRSVRRPPSLRDGKGVAVRKKTKNTITQDNSLLHELISDDNGSDDYGDFEVYHEGPNVERQETPALIELDQYYHDKYDNNYLSDTSLTEEINNDVLSEARDVGMSPETSFADMDNNLINVALEEEVNNDILEDNRGELGALLTSTGRYRVGAINNYKKRYSHVDRPLSKRRKALAKHKSPQAIKRVSIKVYRHPRTGVRNVTMLPNKQHQTYLGDQPTAHNVNENDIEEEEKKERKMNHYVSNRNTPTYNTVVEALSGKFGLAPHKNSRFNQNNDISNDIIIIPELPSLEILDVFFKKTSLIPPDTVSVSLNNKSYVLSRFNTDDIESNLLKIFNSIIAEGSSEEELFYIFKKITNFLWQLNIPSIRPTIEDFHSRFRDKLNTLRQNAKPIHFYILAVCQLMLLEVSKYANVALVSKEGIEKAILNHTASFFSILSVCYDKLTKGNTDILNQSYDILATIIDELNAKEKLWNIFNEKTFIPDVVRLLCNIFPTKKPQWGVIKYESNFSGVRKTLSLIHYCYFRLKWEIQSSVILKLNEIFKARRFYDFEEEKMLSQSNKVRTKPEAIYSCKSTFNGYLLLLSHIEISNSLLEKLTPISRITTLDTSSALVNRFNLLILLAYKSKLNYENRFQLIITQLIELNFTAILSRQDNKQVCQAVLNTIIFFMLNNSNKHIPMKCKVVSMAYLHIIDSSPIGKQLWRMFLIKSRQVISNHKSIWPSFNKELYKCFITFNEEAEDKEQLSLFLRVYIDNLNETSAKWLQANLFSLLKSKADTSVEYIDYYCEVGEYLIKNGEMSWWQFLTYNGLQNNDNIKFYFNSKIIELCDIESFRNIEKDFYTLIINKIGLSSDNEYFWKFCKVLLQKTDSGVSSFDTMTKKNMLNYLPFWKKLFKNLGDLNYKELIKSLMENISRLYQDEKMGDLCVGGVMVYLDAKFLGELQDVRSFNHLRGVFNISNKEMENNEFKKTISKLPTITEQVLHIIRAVLLADYNEVIEEKFVSLFSNTGNFTINQYKLFVTAIMATGPYHSISKNLFRKKMKMSNFLLSSMMKANLEKFYQLTKNEYLESIQLVRFIFLIYNFREVTEIQSTIYSEFMTTCATFILQISSISIGFDESYIIRRYSNYNDSSTNVGSQAEKVDLPRRELIVEIEEILDEDGIDLDDDHYFPTSKEEKKFLRFMDMLQYNL